MIGKLTESSQLKGNLSVGGGTSIEYEAGTGIDITENVISNTITSYNDLTDTPTLSSVATSGSYNDLTDKPTIPTELVAIDKTQDMEINSTYISNPGWTNCTLYGKVCVVSLNANIANNTPNGSVLISNLPKSLQDRVMFCGSLASGNSLRFYIAGDKLCNDGNITIAGWINANLVYIVE